MKRLLCLLLGVLCGVPAWAQDASLPGCELITNFLPLTQITGGGAQPMLCPETTPITQTSGAIAEAITPDITALAEALGYDPTNIFNFVHDQIRYIHYYGSKKGAELTLLERSGNDFDQCALLSALLQASGFPTTYGLAIMGIPYDTNTCLDLHHWLGLDFYNTNWYSTTNYFAYFTGTRGDPVCVPFSDSNTIGLQRIWVNVTIGGVTYYLDPAFKISRPTNGINLSSAMGLSTSNLWAAAGGTDSGYSVTGLNEGALRTALKSCSSNLLAYISNSAPGASVASIVGGQQIVSSVGSPLMTSLVYPTYTSSAYPLLIWTNQPTNFMGTFSIAIGGTKSSWPTPALAGQRLSLTFSNNGVAQLWLEDSNILSTTNLGGSNTTQVIFTATHPYGGWSNSAPMDSGWCDRSSTNTYQTTNAIYTIMYGFEPNAVWLKERQQRLDAYLAAGYTNGSRQLTCETLNVMGLGWMVQAELAHELSSQEWNQLPEFQHRFGRMGQESGRGYYVDLYLQMDGTMPSTGFNTPDVNAMYEEYDVNSFFASAMEHGIIEQLQNSNLVAASTVKMLEIASTNSQPIYMASSSDWTTGPNVRSSLVNYGSTLSVLDTLISNGFILLLPRNGSNQVAGSNTWTGDAYVQLGVTTAGRSMGMMIGAGYYGGYVSDGNSTVNAPYISQISDSQPTYFNPQTPSSPSSRQTGADPVNLVDGTFQIVSSDLSLGQAEPRGLNFTRYYSSERLNANPAGMAPGWLHNYYCTATAISDPEAGLGAETVEQMAPMIVATCAALNLYTNTGNLGPKNWVVTALIAKWGVDQLINNAVSVNLGNDTLEFTRQPDGSYTPPANCTMTLTQTNGAYWLQERHGRSFKFNTHSLLTNIVDPYGQTMKLFYNSNNLLTNVTDWANRSLTLAYTGSNLTSVADGTRTIYYGYTNGELTSCTDPEGKMSVYQYDASNELVATFDALNNLVMTNTYDGYGHVLQQLTEGRTNKAWQIWASGYQTVVKDPAGGAQVYTYDNQSRLIAYQDALGNVTQTIYDGQSHVIQTISPLNETNQSFYDSSNNLIETIDPFGNSNVYVYDGQNNLIARTDANHNTSHFGYNNQFSLTGQTNGNGDWTTFAYYGNGNLQSRTDSGGTTSYGYDSYGALGSVTNAGGAGIDSYQNNIYGDPTNHTNPRTFSTAFQYNKRRQLTNTIGPSNVTTSVSYDAVGNVQTSTDARQNVMTYFWSPTRHQTGAVFPSTPQGTPFTTNTYDNRDWLQLKSNAAQQASYYSNNAAQQLISLADALLRTNTFTYDADGRQKTSADPASETTTQVWDGRGDLTRTIDATQKVIGRAYDTAGNMIFLTNRNTNVWTFQYDKANRLTNTISPSNNTTSEVYNNRGLLFTVTDAKHQTTTFSYDAKGRMTNRSDSIGNIGYQYDGDDNQTAVTNVGQGSGLSWVYDAYDRPVSCTDANGNLIQYRYDANGNLTNLIYPGNLPVKYYYDNLNRVTNITDWAGRQTTNIYDLAGELTNILRPNGTMRSVTYDTGGQVTNIVERYVNGAMAIGYFALNWNNAGRVQWEFAAPLPHTCTPPSRTMTYDGENRLATFNGSNIGVDNDGNMTSGPGTNNTFLSYAYNARNQLTSAGALGYGYDPAGNRTSATNGSTVTTYVVDPKSSQVLMRMRPGMTNYYIYGAGLLYEIDVTANSTNTAYYHYDYRGSTVALTDGSGNVTDRVEYSAYGLTTYRLGTNDTPFLFNGLYGVQTDPNGLLFMRARYYNPYISRFLNADPNGFAGGLNFYAFADENPISEMDPFGLNGWTSVFGGLRVVGGGLEAAAGITLGAATSWTGIGAIGGGLVALHGADQVQAGLRQLFTGNQANSLTSQGLQAAGMSPTAANLTDAGISVVGSFGAGLGTTAIRAQSVISAETANANVVRQAAYYEIGQNTVSDDANTFYSLWANPIDRGAAKVADQGWGVAWPQGYGYTLGIGKTFMTGPTPIGTAGAASVLTGTAAAYNSSTGK